jgi:hypothetical protein
MLNFLQIFSNNTSIPIVLTENDSIINTVNIDEDIVSDNIELSHFIRLKNENDPIVIEYDPGKFKNYITAIRHY